MRLAVLDGDPDQSALLVDTLVTSGLDCTVFESASALLSRLAESSFDLLILDWSRGGEAALQVAVWTQTNLSPPPPILMLADTADAEAIVAGLNAGADDFLTRPLRPSVLLARVNAILRRTQPAEPPARTESFGSHVFDPSRVCVSVEGEDVVLTAKEYALALALFRNLNQALSRTRLLETVWGRNPALATRTLDSHVSKVRTKLSLRPERGYVLAPVYSYGYRLERVTETRRAAEDSCRPRV